MAAGKTKAARRAAARERIAAAREAERRRARRRRVTLWTGGGIAVAAATGAVLVGVTSGHAQHRAPVSSPVSSSGATAPGTALPPWPRPDDTADRARTVGLSVAPMEGTAQHFHVHLDVLVDGKAVPVPADLGIEPAGQKMAELHTHDTTGVLHIEAPTTGKRYVLGQLFTEWNVRLDATDLGGLKADGTRTLTAYVDGKKQSGDPADIQLTPHREIALVYGPANAHPRVPSAYRFEPGL
jgi:hypothetical protein